MSERFLPWSDSCYVCGESNRLGLGVRFQLVGEEVRTTTSLDPRFEGFPGHVHGGVITALLDEAIGWACTARSGSMYLTVELTVRFLRPVPGGQEITVVARAHEAAGRLARGEGQIEDATGTVLAEASGIFFPLPRERNETIAACLKMPGRAATVADLSGEGDD